MGVYILTQYTLFQGYGGTHLLALLTNQLRVEVERVAYPLIVFAVLVIKYVFEIQSLRVAVCQ